VHLPFVPQTATLDRYGVVTTTNGTLNTLDCNKIPSPFVAAGTVHAFCFRVLYLSKSFSLYLSLSLSL
jgi:hypothetical protein